LNNLLALDFYVYLEFLSMDFYDMCKFAELFLLVKLWLRRLIWVVGAIFG
jgi:hypothetical protein